MMFNMLCLNRLLNVIFVFYEYDIHNKNEKY